MAAVRPNPTLTNDLISEILVRVPVKSLLRFQSVCKTWLSLIKDPAFVKSQLRHAITNQNDQLVLPRQNKSLISLSHVDSPRIVADLKLPYSEGEVKSVDSCYIAGSANGIVCVAVDFEFVGIRKKTNIYLWNPAIRQSKLVPSLFNTCEKIVFVKVLGFGYDGVDHDFKVVSATMVWGGNPSYCYDVYSDNRNAWRNVPQWNYRPHRFSFDVCINGFLCGVPLGYYGVMTFDMNQEVQNCAINLPVIDDAHAQEVLLNCTIKLIDRAYAHDGYYYDDGFDDIHLIEFNNSVAVIMLLDGDKKINMWTLDNDACLRGGGVEASWTPMFSIDLGMRADLIHGYSSNGNLLVIIGRGGTSNMWISCNADKKEAKIVPALVDSYALYTCFYKYTESLISLAGFKYVN